MNIQSVLMDYGINDEKYVANSRAMDTKFQNILSEKIENISYLNVEETLKTKYPLLSYHVYDASEFKYWNRLDFPISEVFKNNANVEKLKQWKPSTPYATGYEDYVQADLLSIPQGAYAVIIHPDTQKRMDSDPQYAKEVIQRIDKHFQDTIRLNESICPGCTDGMRQAVCIDENGQISFQASVGNGPDYVKTENNLNEDNAANHDVNNSKENGQVNNNQTISNFDNEIINVYEENHYINYEELISKMGIGVMDYPYNKKKE